MSSQLGLGVMINMLGGNEETVKAIKASLDKKIKHISFTENELIFKFEDDSRLRIWDDGQSCCENRYMHSDDLDKMEKASGSRLLSLEVKDALSKHGEGGDEHDIQFLVVKTSKGEFTIETHVEHNGYYGGFSITAKLLDANN